MLYFLILKYVTFFYAFFYILWSRDQYTAEHTANWLSHFFLKYYRNIMSRGRLGNLTLLFCGNVYQKVFIFFLCFRKRASCFLIYIPSSVVFTSCFLYKEKKLILLLMFSWFIKSTRRKTSKHKSKELSLCHKLKSSGHNIFATWWCKPLIFQI